MDLSRLIGTCVPHNIFCSQWIEQAIQLGGSGLKNDTIKNVSSFDSLASQVDNSVSKVFMVRIHCRLFKILWIRYG